MSLHKIYNFVGYNNLGLILEQERKHWLLKPDKKLNVQDSATGSIFQGRLDNMGNEIVVETNKTNAYTGSDMFRFTNDMFNVVFEPLSSTLPYNNALNGLMYECIMSSKIAYVDNNTTSYKNYKLKFVDCEEVIIPFGDSIETSNVYAGKWLRTTSRPIVVLPDSTSVYNIEIPLEYEDTVTGCVYYYPLEENMQPLSITNTAQGVYVTEAVTDSTFIGYPIYWFTSDNTNVGPHITITNNVSDDKTLMYIANPGNVSKYLAQIFCSVDGNLDAAPYGESTSDWKVECKTFTGDFSGTTGDILIPIDLNSIKLVRISDNTEYDIHFETDNNDVVTLTSIELWARNGNTAWTLMSNFDRNCYQQQQTEQHTYELIPLFNLHLDETVSFLHNTTDVGYAGVHMSSEPYLESGERYPYDLSKWDGIPQWLQDNEEGAPQHVALYAIHNTPNYNENDPKSRQTTAILLDPGKQKTSDDETLADDEKGRAYLLSNDDAVYDNNATSEHPKPPRTLARICDIPSSITQLTNITGLAPTTVVDKNYVHTDACYTDAEKEKVWNTLSSRWVRPTMMADHSNYDNDFIFNNVEDLNSVDLLSPANDLCQHINLNSSVNPHNIEVNVIADRGTNYNVNETGVVIIGGSSITYLVGAVDENHGVLSLSLEPTSDNPINLSNFDLADPTSGDTAIYGTSPVTGEGHGLKFSMTIRDYDSIRPKRGAVYPDLYALVRQPDGLWLFQHTNEWEKRVLVSEAESSSTITGNGGLSTTDAFMTSIVSSIRTLPINSMANRIDPIQLKVMTTPSFVNILDTTHIPFTPVPNTYINKSIVDMNKLVCGGIGSGIAEQKNGPYVIDYLRKRNLLKYDSYVIWRWVDPDTHSSNTTFTYGIVNRSFNNFQSTDSTTLLPMNSLNCSNYVHTNEQTTIVWNVDGVGVLMWVYDPRNSIYETYAIDRATMDITIKRDSLTFENIDVRNTSTPFKIADDNGKLLYNIWTNNPLQQSTSWIKPTDPIYQQPDFNPIATVGTPVNNVHPIGCWRLVYPRINSYKFTNSTSGASYDAIKMDMIRGENLGNIGNITNQYDQVVNKKILVMDRQTNGTALKVYNDQTNTWDKI